MCREALIRTLIYKFLDKYFEVLLLEYSKTPGYVFWSNCFKTSQIEVFWSILNYLFRNTLFFPKQSRNLAHSSRYTCASVVDRWTRNLVSYHICARLSLYVLERTPIKKRGRLRNYEWYDPSKYKRAMLHLYDKGVHMATDVLADEANHWS